MKITFLGTGAGQPSIERNTTSIAIEIENKEFILVDCGEGTLKQLMISNLKYSSVKAIFITHLHGDHIFGLPGYLCTLNINREQPLQIFGPKGLKKYCDVFSDHIRSFPLIINEISGDYKDVCTLNYNSYKIIVEACHIKHTVECYSYCFTQEKIKNKIDLPLIEPILTKYEEELKNAGFNPPKKILKEIASNSDFTFSFKSLENGSDVEICAKNYVFKQRNTKLVVALDNFNCDNIFTMFRDCDVLIHESTYVILPSMTDPIRKETLDKAISHGHSTNTMAAINASKMNATHLILTHFSNRYHMTDKVLDDAENIIETCRETGFENRVSLAYDFSEFEIKI